MMKLKFRVWDRKQFRYLATVDGSWYELFSTREESLQVERSGKRGFLSLGYAIQRDDLYLVEQYTGLNDNYGTEIYVNDIVEVNGQSRRIVFRDCGFFCEGSDYGLNTIWFRGGNPKVVACMADTILITS